MRGFTLVWGIMQTEIVPTAHLGRCRYSEAASFHTYVFKHNCISLVNISSAAHCPPAQKHWLEVEALQSGAADLSCALTA